MSTSQLVNGFQQYLPARDDAEWGGVLQSLAAALQYKQVALLTFCGSSGMSPGVYLYMPPGYAAFQADELFVRAPFTGKAVAMFARTRVAGDDESYTFGLRVNESDSLMGAIMLPPDTTASDTAHSISITAGDTLSVNCYSESHSTGMDDTVVTIVLVAA